MPIEAEDFSVAPSDDSLSVDKVLVLEELIDAEPLDTAVVEVDWLRARSTSMLPISVGRGPFRY